MVSETLKMHEITDSDGDRSALRTMAEAYWKETIPNSRIAQDPAYRARYFETRFRPVPNASYQWWAKRDETNIGFANVSVGKNAAGEAFGFIDDLYIVPEWRRRGYGDMFVQLVLQWMKDRGAKRVGLHVESDSAEALAFWEHVGFTRIQYVMLREF